MLKSCCLKIKHVGIILLLLLFLLPSCTLPMKTLYDQNDPDLAKYESDQVPSAADFVELPIDFNPNDFNQAAFSPSVKFGIYNGIGSWDENVKALEEFFTTYNLSYTLFNENDIVSNNLLDQFDLIWFPGGFASEYRYYIEDHQTIQEFVAGGGAYIGSCAGAYYAADILRWMGEDYDYPLKLYRGVAVGPLVNEINWGEEAEILLNPLLTANEGYGQAIAIYYFDGPYFAADNQAGVTILGRYAINNQPAIIAGRYGQGKYLLFGPHPELGDYNQQQDGNDTIGNNGTQWPWLFSVLIWFSQM